MSNMPNHLSEWVEVGDYKADIDLLLVPLIKEMWRVDIETAMCCQEWEKGKKRAWISFEHHEDFLRFIDIGSGSGYSNFYIQKRICSPTYSTNRNNWKYGFTPQNNFIYDDGHDFCLECHVWFPQSDIPRLIKNFREYQELNDC